jgi:hypothetical protein
MHTVFNGVTNIVLFLLNYNVNSEKYTYICTAELLVKLLKAVLSLLGGSKGEKKLVL